LVELRTGTSDSTVVAQRAGFLKSNGMIVGLDGVNPLRFGLPAGDYYMVVRHRNHLAVMSAGTVSLPNSTAYDFTTAETQAYTTGPAPMVNLGGSPSKYGMWAGDADGNGQIQNSDKNSYWQVQVGLSGYQSADFNLNGQVQNNDKNSYWSVNVGLGTQVP
jgi:hypothetical protein